MTAQLKAGRFSNQAICVGNIRIKMAVQPTTDGGIEAAINLDSRSFYYLPTEIT